MTLLEQVDFQLGLREKCIKFCSKANWRVSFFDPQSRLFSCLLLASHSLPHSVLLLIDEMQDRSMKMWIVKSNMLLLEQCMLETLHLANSMHLRSNSIVELPETTEIYWSYCFSILFLFLFLLLLHSFYSGGGNFGRLENGIRV